MPIDIDTVLAAELPIRSGGWDEDKVILYHLGLGAGGKPTDTAELGYVYERGLKVLPTYGVIEASQSLLDLFNVNGFDVKLSQILHGDQELTIHAPLPPAAEVTTRARVADIYDKQSGALVILETVTSHAQGDDLCTNRFGLFIRGEGGFGGHSGPRAADTRPEREPDLVTDIPTLPQQALIYRLSGDRNPLHVDPAFASDAGFDRPILHGLCSFGIACRAVVDACLDGDVTAVTGYRTRFAGVAFPGETIRVAVWRGEGHLHVEAHSAERSTSVLSDGVISTR